MSPCLLIFLKHHLKWLWNSCLNLSCEQTEKRRLRQHKGSLEELFLSQGRYAYLGLLTWQKKYMKGLMEELLMASQWEQNQRMLMYLKLGKKKKRHEVGFAFCNGSGIQLLSLVNRRHDCRQHRVGLQREPAEGEETDDKHEDLSRGERRYRLCFRVNSL